MTGGGLRTAVDAPPVAGALGLAARALTIGTGRVTVLMYHRAGDPDAFRAQVEWLVRHARPLSAEGFELALAQRRAPGRRSVLVTFDDAYRDFAEVAWPILREAGVPAVLFVPTAYPDAGRAFWWDELEHALTRTERVELEYAGERLSLRGPDAVRRSWKRLRQLVKGEPHARAMDRVRRALDELGVEPRGSEVLGWDELRRLAEEGVHVAAHTREHPMLPRLRFEEQVAEIAGSREALARELGSESGWFAYPSGYYDPSSRRAASEAGVRVAFSTVDGSERLATCDPLRLRRVDVRADESLGAFCARLARAAGVRARRRLPERFPEATT